MGLKNPPSGDKVRPWEALGMSRATWYRQGKPATNNRDFFRQKGRAQMMGGSLRSIQRISFSRRYGIPELAEFELEKHFMLPTQLETVAKWPHEWQADFVKAMIEFMKQSPKVREPTDDEFRNRRPICDLCIQVGGPQVRRLAAYLIKAVDTSS